MTPTLIVVAGPPGPDKPPAGTDVTPPPGAVVATPPPAAVLVPLLPGTAVVPPTAPPAAPPAAEPPAPLTVAGALPTDRPSGEVFRASALVPAVVDTVV